MAKQIKKIASPNLQEPLTATLLGQVVKARRTQSNLRLEDAAALCGVAKETFMKIEHGHAACRLESVLQVCAGLGITLFIKPWINNNDDENEWR